MTHVTLQVPDVEFRLGEIEHLPVADAAVDAGASELVFVVGYKAEHVRAYFDDEYRGTPVTLRALNDNTPLLFENADTNETLATYSTGVNSENFVFHTTEFSVGETYRVVFNPTSDPNPQVPNKGPRRVKYVALASLDLVASLEQDGMAFERDEAVTVEAVLASAAVLNVFEAVEIHGHYHWDGLFSQNPPVGDIMHQPPERKPDELWIVQINPQELEGEPTSLEEIADRCNELSGNISLNQEMRFVEQINEWVEAGKLPAEEFAQTTVHRIEMGRDYHCSTKLDRDPDFIAELMDLGHERGAGFLAER